MAVRGTRTQPLGPVHPECIFLLEFRQVLRKRSGFVTRGKEPNHLEEEGRLRPAQIIAPVPVRNVPIGVDEKSEVADQIPNKILATSLRKSKHGEIGVPLLAFTKTRPRNTA